MLNANEIYQKIAQMYPNACCELNYNNNFELLVSTVLAAQATDKSVNKVTGELFSKYPDAKALSDAKFEDVKEIIKTIGLANSKARNIIELSKQLVNDYDGVIPADFDYLVTLKGVGRKTANVLLAEGFKIPRIAVDTHVSRVSNRLGLSKSSDPIVIEKDLMNLYEEKNWGDVHLKLLFFGRYFCKSQNPECDKNEYCPFKDFCQR